MQRFIREPNNRQVMTQGFGGRNAFIARTDTFQSTVPEVMSIVVSIAGSEDSHLWKRKFSLASHLFVRVMKELYGKFVHEKLLSMVNTNKVHHKKWIKLQSSLKQTVFLSFRLSPLHASSPPNNGCRPQNAESDSLLWWRWLHIYNSTRDSFEPINNQSITSILVFPFLVFLLQSHWIIPTKLALIIFTTTPAVYYISSPSTQLITVKTKANS